MPELLTIDPPAEAPEAPTTEIPSRKRRSRVRMPAVPAPMNLRRLPARRRRTVLGLVALALVGVGLLLAFSGSSAKHRAHRSAVGVGAPLGAGAGVPAVNAPSAPGSSVRPGQGPGAIPNQKLGKIPPVVGTPIGGTTPHPVTVTPIPSPPAVPSTPASVPSTPAPSSSTPAATTPAPAAPVYANYPTFRTDLLFGTSAAHLRAVSGAARFTTFPSAHHPIVTFLGLEANGTTAEFLVYGRLKTAGDGSCRPSADACTLLSLKPGDRELITAVRDGVPTNYGLAYTSLTRGHVRATSAPAPAVSPSGEWLIELVAGRYMPELATLKYSASGLLLSHLTPLPPAG